MAWLYLEARPHPEAIQCLQRQFRVDATTAREDFRRFRSKIEGLLGSEGACPVHDLELEVLKPFDPVPSAPYRMDLALTYRCNCNCAHCYNARPRGYPEMESEKWHAVLDALWEVGIPHICFTGGEATLRPDLPELIGYAQDLGQITGLLTNGRRLADRAFLRELVHSGLDHVQITLESHDPSIHDRMVQAKGAWDQTVGGIQNALDENLYVMTNTTLLKDNAPSIEATVDFLAELGVPTMGCNALIYAGSGTQVGTGLEEEELVPLLEVVRERTDRYGMRLIWYTPTQYCHFDPMQLELGVKTCTAARYNMCVEPDGQVIPCQSYYAGLGNMLHDPWDRIWNHDLSRWLRNREFVPEVCRACAVLTECGGGCPLSLPHQQPKPTFAAERAP
jgi:radical SAM protein with 4Fe4S-binding SPASM domain